MHQISKLVRTPKDQNDFNIYLLEILIVKFKRKFDLNSSFVMRLFFFSFKADDNYSYLLQTIGCDLELESGNVVDRCGVCKGLGNTCEHITGEDKEPHASPGKFAALF